MNIISKIRIASVILSGLLIISCSDDDDSNFVGTNGDTTFTDAASTDAETTDTETTDAETTDDEITDDEITDTEITETTELIDSQSDLELTLSNYENNQVFETGDVDFEFVITNVGETTLEAGSNIYASIMFNEAQFDLDLVATGDDAATTLVLDEDLAPGESFTHVTSPVDFLNVEATLQFIGVTYVDICSIAWGTTEASIGTYESDADSEDNIFCIGFGSDEDSAIDETTTGVITELDDSQSDLELTLSNRTNNEVIETGDVDFEFVITNVGETTLEAGSSVYLSIKFDEIQFDLDLVGQGEDAATELVLDEDLAPGEFFTHVTSPVDFLNVEATLGFLPLLGLEGTYLDVCSVLWGTTEASIGTFESDSNSEDNTFCLGFGTE